MKQLFVVMLLFGMMFTPALAYVEEPQCMLRMTFKDNVQWLGLKQNACDGMLNNPNHFNLEDIEYTILNSTMGQFEGGNFNATLKSTDPDGAVDFYFNPYE